jgi:hypothetical protein
MQLILRSAWMRFETSQVCLVFCDGSIAPIKGRWINLAVVVAEQLSNHCCTYAYYDFRHLAPDNFHILSVAHLLKIDATIYQVLWSD